jgi:hypothetical protein
MARDAGASIQRNDATATALHPAATEAAAIAPTIPFIGGRL